MIQQTVKNTKTTKLFGVPSGLIVLLIFFTSCSASKKINEKLIIGNWNRNKIISLSTTAGSDNYEVFSEALGLPLTGNVSKSESSKKVELDMEKIEQFSNSDLAKEEKFVKFKSIFPDFKNTIEFKADKKVIISTQKTMMNGTWKMNGKGDKIKLSIQDVSAPMRLTLLKIDSTTMEIVDHFPNSDFQILYQKK